MRTSTNPHRKSPRRLGPKPVSSRAYTRTRARAQGRSATFGTFAWPLGAANPDARPRRNLDFLHRTIHLPVHRGVFAA